MTDLLRQKKVTDALVLLIPAIHLVYFYARLEDAGGMGIAMGTELISTFIVAAVLTRKLFFLKTKA
jgi:hypothetical protein